MLATLFSLHSHFKMGAHGCSSGFHSIYNLIVFAGNSIKFNSVDSSTFKELKSIIYFKNDKSCNSIIIQNFTKIENMSEQPFYCKFWGWIEPACCNIIQKITRKIAPARRQPPPPNPHVGLGWVSPDAARKYATHLVGQASAKDGLRLN